MASDHPDDTILDDELDENDFNFDNENEDALLAETDYDFVEKTETRLIDDTDQQEAEEDVLDIGIAEEDIVDSEPICISQTTSCEIQSQPEINTENESVEFSKSEDDTLPVQTDTTTTTTTIETTTIETCDYSEIKSEDSEKNEQETIISSNNEFPVTRSTVPSKKEENQSEKSVKSTVISLKKSAGKNYDNLPALAKVIEKVQPSTSSSSSSSSSTLTTSSRNRRVHGKEHDDEIRSRKRVDERSSKRRYNYDDSRRSERRRYGNENSGDHYHDTHDRSSRYRSEEHSSSKWKSHVDDSFSDEYESDRQLIESTSNSNQQYEEPNYDNNSIGFTQQSIVASVHITQERYQITSDFTVPLAGSTFTQSYSDYSAVQSAPNFQAVGPTQQPQPQPQPLLQPPRQRMPPPYNGNPYMRPPPGPAPGIRPPAMGPFPRVMQPPSNVQNQFPPPNSSMCMNRPPPLGRVGGIYPHQNAPFPPPTSAQPMSLPPPTQQQLPPPVPVSHMRPQHPLPPPMNQALPPPPRPVSGHPQFQAPMPPHMRPNTVHSQMPMPPPNNFVRPPMIPHRGPPQGSLPYRPFVPQQMPQGPHPPPPRPQPMPPHSQAAPPPLMNSTYASYPNNDPRMQSHMAFRPPAQQLPPPVSTPQHNMNPPMVNVQNSLPPATSYQQPPPPGVVVSQPPSSQSSFYQSSNNDVNYVQYKPEPQSQPPPQQQQFYANDNFDLEEENTNKFKRINSSSIESGPFKQTRYDFSPVKKADDDDMELYRKKVEHQKRLREKFVQMKEEQRLKNQMQSFIQNNIKGILEKREQFLRKSEAEKQSKNESHSRMTHIRNNDSSSNSGSSYNSGAGATSVGGGVKTIHNEDTMKRRVEEKPTRRIETNATLTSAKTKSSNLRIQPQDSSSKDSTNVSAEKTEQRQLHKVIKIKYRDGTVAFKSIPVHGSDDAVLTKNNSSHIRSGTPIAADRVRAIFSSGEKGAGDDDGNRHVFTSRNIQRRMVVSKNIPVANVKNEASNENAIVESIRKVVTQSSVPLAQRFTNLRSSNKQLNARPV